MPERTEVLIVGGGIIGLMIAREAAAAGMAVRLLDRGEPGGEASSASAGMLAAQLEAEGPGPLLTLGLQSRALWSSVGDAIEAESGVGAGRRDEGILALARDEAEARHLERRCALQREAGLEVARLDAEEVVRLEPALAAAAIRLALHLPHDVSYDSRLLLRALRIAAGRAGARITAGAPVHRLLERNGAVGGALAGAERIEADAVVIAAGAWSGDIAAPGAPPLPMHPVRGQIVCLDPAEPPFRHMLATERCYLVPRRDGRILVGSTMERAGFDRRVTAGAVARLAAAAIDLVPVLEDATVDSAWAGLRPSTADGLPAIGPGPRPGLYYACGHLRSGILLAPITARVIVRLLRGEAPGIDLTPFDPRRFAAARPAGEGAAAPTSRSGSSFPAV